MPVGTFSATISIRSGTVSIRSGPVFIRSDKVSIRSGPVFIRSDKVCISHHCKALILAAYSATVRVSLTEHTAASLAIIPCLPDIDYPIGQTLQLTIESRADSDTPDAPAERNTAGHLPRDLNTIRDVFSALRTCWVPPEKDVARSGTQITLRLSFNSHGGIIAEPRTTYVSPDTPPDVRQVYWDAATAALKRCTPLQFTDGLGGALAGRPFAIRFVDDRSF